ncbi:hypothetical protein J2X11_000107 [Aeromicrobium panaciterrae]|uniref:Uncharacterized protein n=1 Tax=Aeromicrobium panaciterrae TaxID=363861 RepID=A0ABU1UJC1_9ACTN|nr:hypothetical protein [Aeromicrobium panaciterrae]
MIITAISAVVIAVIGVAATARTVNHDGFGRIPTQLR